MLSVPIFGSGECPCKTSWTNEEVAMSDRQSELEFKLNNVVLAVSDVAEWFDLGLQLGLPSATLRLIAADPNIKDIKSQRLAMLSEWLKYDTAASWEKLAAALATIGENVVAANVRSQFMKVTTTLSKDISEDEKTCQEMKQNVLRTIKCQFASLQIEVRSAMECRQIKVSDVHQFLVASFQDECSIPEAPDLTKIFNIVTESKLWRYDNYIPLKKLAEKFLPDDDPVQKHITEYRSQLSGFYTTTKIIDFIDLSKLEEADDDTEQPAFVAENYKKHYRKLTLQLKLDRKVKLSSLTLNYVDTLWKALIEEFNLPPLTAVIDGIVSGSLIITWLVPPQVSNVIAASYSKALRFYQQHNIIEVELDGRTLYDEEWIVHSTGLYQASFVGDTDEVKKLLEGGADVNEPNDNKYGETALFGACRGGHVETTKVLLDHRAIVDYQNKNGHSVLWWASDAGETECAKVLVKYGVQVDLPDKNGYTALILACRGGHVETARVLLDHGANVDHQNNRGETALNLACYYGKSQTISLLLKAGAKTDIQEEDGLTALWWAAYKGCDNIVQMLVDHGVAVDLGRHNETGRTGLMWASRDGHSDTVRVLLEAKADPNITDEDGETALHKAAREGHVEIVKMLVKYGAAVDIRNKDGETALHKAALRGRVEVVKTLVEHGAAVDVRNKEGLTALEVARGHGYQAVCEVLEQYTKQETRTELTKEQRESIYQRLLKMAERIFLKEQVKKREEQQQKKEHHHQREERVRGEREKRSLWNRLRRRQDMPGQIIGTAPASDK